MGETHGRKLQDEEGRWETRVKISEMRRCCTLVSWWEDVSLCIILSWGLKEGERN